MFLLSGGLGEGLLPRGFELSGALVVRHHRRSNIGKFSIQDS